MRRKEIHRLGLKHLVKHMDVWEEHLRRLRQFYIEGGQGGTIRYHEVQADIAKLREWRERLDAIDPRRDRTSDVSVLQSSARGGVPESNR